MNKLRRLGVRWQGGSRDTAFGRAEIAGLKLNLRAGESVVALRFPPQSKMLSAHFCPCTAGGFWKDSLMAEVMADKVRQNAPQLFWTASVTDCLLSELANTGSD